MVQSMGARGAGPSHPGARAARVSALRGLGFCTLEPLARSIARTARGPDGDFFFSRALNWEVKSLVTLFLLETLSHAGEKSLETLDCD